MATPIRLDVGCGDYVAPGYTGVDPFYTAPGIVDAPAHKLPYGNGMVAAIRTSHALEHIAPADVAAALTEFYRVLEPGGLLEVIVPDSLYVLQRLIDHPDDEWSTIMVHGQGRWPGDAHLSAWAPDTLAKALEGAGFVSVTVVRQWTPQQNQMSIVATATRSVVPRRYAKKVNRPRRKVPASVRLSVIIPTVGRPSLLGTLASIAAAGVEPADEVILVADGGAPEAHHIAAISGLEDRCTLRVLDLDPAGGDYGQPARNFGMAQATGTHLVFTQDDNAFIEGALLAVRHEAEMAPEALHFWRVRPQGGQWVWDVVSADGLPELGHIDADCGVVPNDPARLGEWGEGYNGDADFWRATAARFLPLVQWHEELISGHQRFL